MLGVAIVYLGLAAVFLALVSLLRPLAFLAIRSRKLALVILASGILVVVVGELLPARETRVIEPRMHLDEFMPVDQFNEFHSVRVKASREQVYRAIKSVTADEITFFRTLVWMRRMGRSGPESILNPPAGEPILDVATRTSFIVLAEEPDREIVLGTLVAAPPG